jgi:hypothetical protein
VEGVTFVHLSTAFVIVHIGAIHVFAHDVIGIVSEHEVIWALEY